MTKINIPGPNRSPPWEGSPGKFQGTRHGQRPRPQTARGPRLPSFSQVDKVSESGACALTTVSDRRGLKEEQVILPSQLTPQRITGGKTPEAGHYIRSRFLFLSLPISLFVCQTEADRVQSYRSMHVRNGEFARRARVRIGNSWNWRQ